LDSKKQQKVTLGITKWTKKKNFLVVKICPLTSNKHPQKADPKRQKFRIRIKIFSVIKKNKKTVNTIWSLLRLCVYIFYKLLLICWLCSVNKASLQKPYLFFSGLFSLLGFRWCDFPFGTAKPPFLYRDSNRVPYRTLTL
jgi:hypothetical protein